MATKVRLDLTKLKSSGVYTFEFDQSESVIITPQTVKLVIGYSKKGPFNSPVLLNDPKVAKRVFGDIDAIQERKGNFFHRTILKGLETGPVIALNLLKLNDDELSLDPDMASYQSMSLDFAEANGVTTQKLLSSYYNKERFWFADTSYLLATRESIDSSKLLNFVNLSNTPSTILVRKADVKGYDITAKEWYGAGNVPEYLRENDLLKEYFLEVISIKGDWTDFSALALDPMFSSYFTVNGIRKDQLENFLALNEIEFNGRWIGTIIPDFIDANGVNQFLETIVNANVGTTGLFTAVNKEALDDIVNNGSQIDLVGHNLIGALSNPDFNELNFLSYKQTFQEDYTYDESFTGSPLQPFEIPVSDVIAGSDVVVSSGTGARALLTIDRTINNYAEWLERYVAGTSMISCLDVATDPAFLNIYSVTATATTLLVTIDVPYLNTVQGGGTAYDLNGAGTTYEFVLQPDACYADNTIATNDALIGFEYSQVYKDFEAGKITSGDIMIVRDSVGPDVNNTYYLKIYKSAMTISGAVDMPVVVVEKYTTSTFTGANTAFVFNEDTFIAADIVDVLDIDYVGPSNTSNTKTNIISAVGAYNERVPVTAGVTANQVLLSATTQNGKIKVGDYLVASDGTHLTRVLQVSTNPSNTAQLIVTAYEAIKLFAGNEVEKYKSIESFVTTYNPSVLSGWVLRDRHQPNGTNSRMNEIYSVLTNTNLFNMLTDKDLITFRYIVDCFNHGLEPQSKSILTNLAKTRGKALAILNAPSIKEFINSTDPRFTDEPTAANPKPLLNTEYIATGGNLSLNPSFAFSLPSEQVGAKYSGFFTPNITIRENNKNMSVPPAMYVANNFVRKFINGTPYSVVAGTSRGTLEDPEIVGLEYNYLTTDRDVIEPFGLNPIIIKRGYGPMIYANQTSYQKVNSAFNNLHVRDTLITIEESIESILEQYLFEFNEASIRLEIETAVKSFLSQVQSDGGIGEFKVFMNSSNNTPTTIDQNIGIIDVIVEPTRAIQKFVNKITITKTGGIAAGGFAEA